MVLFELVRSALEAGVELVGVNVETTIVLALAVVLVGTYYAREIARFFVTLARVINIGGLAIAAVLVGTIVAIGAGVLNLEGVSRLLELVGELVRGVL